MSLVKVKFYVLFILSLFSFNTLQAKAFDITEAEINQYLTKNTHIENKIGFPGFLTINYKLQNIQTKIGNNQRMTLAGMVEGLFNMNASSFADKIYLSFDTVPYYDVEKGQIYLKDVQILNWSTTSNSHANQLKTVMPFISQSVAQMLNQIPVYTLDDKDTKQLLIKKVSKRINIKEGKLKLETGLF